MSASRSTSFALVTAGLLAVLAWMAPNTASAFCGTYVNGGDSEMFNNATQAVMMREDKTTVLSMQNDYEGPPEDFAIVIPTPEVLNKENVKTIDDAVFDKIDRLTAPRLVEYWEQDPCTTHGGAVGGSSSGSAGGGVDGSAGTSGGSGGTVEVEAKFTVGEYDVVVLSSDESTALESWLKNNGYNIPPGSAPYLQPYISSGSYFFVAKVDTDKVEFDDNGRALLSPLRFHYQSDSFKLPVRLGLINSKGQQDLIVHTLGRNQRYEVANYPNVTIPTNLRVKNSVKKHFPSFYRALFRETLKNHKKDGKPNPVVTEYSWNASSCDPCPGPTLDRSDFVTLGADVLYGDPDGGGGTAGSSCPELLSCVGACPDNDATCEQSCRDQASDTAIQEYDALITCAERNCQGTSSSKECVKNNCSSELDSCRNAGSTSGGSTSGGSTSGDTTGTTTGTTTGGSPDGRNIPTDWTITRLHARYDEKTVGKDLVFSEAPPIRGGRGQPGDLKTTTESSRRNNFQGRYIITHRWDGPVDCEDPNFGHWGGKNGGSPSASSAPGPTTREGEFEKKDIDVDSALADDDLDDGQTNNSDTGSSAPDAAGSDASGRRGSGTNSEQGGCSVEGTAPHPTPAKTLAALLGVLMWLKLRGRSRR